MDAQIAVPNSRWKTKNFAKKVGITYEQAKFIEFMRDRYITWEHDYIKESLKEPDNIEAR